MIKFKREDIYIISRHSNWQEGDINKAFKAHVYSDSKDWQNFLRLFLVSLGTGFMVSGVVFFFAYNWADLHKFIKFALVEVIVIATVLVLLLPKINVLTQNIILTGASFLVGVLFAVFGQVYQTGANAYDFFLSWTLLILLWVIVADFAPLWLLFLVLVNTTFIFYNEQVAYDWYGVWFFTILSVMNTAFLIGAMLIPFYRKTAEAPVWWTNVVALLTVFCCTMGINTGIFSYDPGQNISFYLLSGFVAVLFTAGVGYGLRYKNGFYIAIIAFSLIFIVSSVLIRISDGFEILLVVSFFVILSTSITVKFLIELQKKWSNEK